MEILRDIGKFEVLKKRELIMTNDSSITILSESFFIEIWLSLSK